MKTGTRSEYLNAARAVEAIDAADEILAMAEDAQVQLLRGVVFGLLALVEVVEDLRRDVQR